MWSTHMPYIIITTLDACMARNDGDDDAEFVSWVCDGGLSCDACERGEVGSGVAVGELEGGVLDFGALAFYDVGNVYFTVSDTDLTDLRHVLGSDRGNASLP